MAEARVSASQLAKNTGLPATTVKRIRNNANANPTLISLLPIATFFKISLSQLIGEESLPGHTIKGVFLSNQGLWTKVPIITWEQAIAWKKQTPSLTQKYASTDKLVSADAYALEVYEENWENLAPNTQLIVDPQLKPEHRDYVVVYKKGQDKASLKQVLFDDNEIYLKSVVLGYNIQPFTNQHKFLGVIVEYKMELKKEILTS